jgi:hypothetical protein
MLPNDPSTGSEHSFPHIIRPIDFSKVQNSWHYSQNAA